MNTHESIILFVASIWRGAVSERYRLQLASLYSQLSDLELRRTFGGVFGTAGDTLADYQMRIATDPSGTFNLKAARSALELIRMVSHTLETVQSPTLIVQSHRDTVVCPSGARLLMNRLGSPVKEVYWLEESNHVILLDSERDAVMDRILTFVAHTQSSLSQR